MNPYGSYTIFKDAIQAVNGTEVWQSPTSGWPDGYHNGSQGHTYINCAKTINGYRSPNYSQLMRKFQDASTPYARWDIRFNNIFTSSRGLLSEAWIDNPGDPNMHTWAYTGYTGVPALITSMPSRPIPDDIALKRLKRKLSQDTKQFRTLIPLAEVNETRRLVRSTAEATTGVLKKLIEIKHGRLKGMFSRASKAWLQFSFAISPTISDLQDAANSVVAYLLRQDGAISHYGGAEDVWIDYSGTAGSVSGATGVVWDYPKQTNNHIYRVRYTAGVLYDIRSSNNYGLDDQFGLSFGQLVPVLWELIPYSWVVDYFTTTGAFLDDAFTSNAGTTFYCTKTQRHWCTSSVRFTSRWNGGSTPHRFFSETKDVDCSCHYMRRAVLAQLPHRALRVKSIDEVGTMAVTKVLNLASVLLR